MISYQTSCTASAQAYWGTSYSSQPNQVAGNTTTYTLNSYTSNYIHHVLVSGLPVGSKDVFYYVGDSKSGYSAVLNFSSHPGFDLAPIPKTFAIVGDLGQVRRAAWWWTSLALLETMRKDGRTGGSRANGEREAQKGAERRRKAQKGGSCSGMVERASRKAKC